MKNQIRKDINLIILLLGALLFHSCSYKEVADAAYFEQQVYIPAAVFNPYLIDAVPAPIGSVPTPGQTYRLTVDIAGGKFQVPLTAFRGGINYDGKVSVQLAANTDTITKLIAINKTLPVGSEILPADKYVFEPSVDISDGKENQPFTLNIDLAFLRNNPNKIYAIGIKISSNERTVNLKLNTVLVVIYTKILKPAASFTFKTDPLDAKKIIFTNTSTYSTNWTWDFGDGSTVSSEKSPTHSYSATGTYSVKLISKGVTGDMDKVEITNTVTAK